MYQNSAYNSNKVPLQKMAVKKGLLAQYFSSATHLLFTHTADILATKALSYYKPSHWQQDEEKRRLRPETEFAWNEETMGQDVYSAWTMVYLNVAGISKACVLFVLPLYFLILLGNYIFNDLPSSELGGLISWSLSWSLPFALIWLQFELLNRGYFMLPFLKARRLFELNRRTGMVTLYRHNKPYFTHPFIEFDCFLSSAPSHQGLMNYSLLLIHRYNGYHHGVPLHVMLPSHQNVKEYQRLWNMVQQYMDVSRPLPDILMLEAVRSKDETTRLYDMANPRDPNYWRNMSDEEFDRTLEEIAITQQSQPATGEEINIFAQTESSQCPSCSCVIQGDGECEQCNRQANISEPALHQAVWQGDWARARQLLAQGADVNEPNSQGKTPLDLAREREDSLIIKLLEGDDAVKNMPS